MDASTAILARLNQGPADKIDLHSAICHLTGVRPGTESAAWPMVIQTIAEMVRSGHIVAHPNGWYQIPVGVPMEPREPEPNKTSTPGSAQSRLPAAVLAKWRGKK